MDWKTLRASAREKFKGACRVCPVCNGIACAGEVPGMGGLGTGSAFCSNVQALATYRLNLRTIHEVRQAKTSCSLLGMTLDIPVIGAPIGGIGLNMNGALSEEEYTAAVVAGCRQAGTISMTGDGPRPEVFEAGLKAVRAAGGQGIPVIKPRSNQAIVELAKQAADAGAPAFGVDVDAAALVNMTNAGQPVGPKSPADLEYIKQNTPIPFIVKGIMTPEDAEACYQSGADAIVVSNHGGRALDGTPATAEVLPEIADIAKGRIVILVDGGIRSGTDVLKMLGLGADAVLIGRPLAVGAVGGGPEGVGMVLAKVAAELRAALLLTGTADVTDVNPEILW